MNQPGRGPSVVAERPTKTDLPTVCESVNRTCEGTWDFRGLSVAWRHRLRGATHDADCLFVGKAEGALVSVAYGSFHKARGLAAIERACAFPNAPDLATVPPLLACVGRLKERGADRVVVAHWHDRPYIGLLGSLENAGRNWQHKSLYLRSDLAAIPAWSLPPGYTIRSYQMRDPEVWAQLRGDIFGSRPRPEDFWEQKYLGLSMKADFDPDAFLFAEKEGQAVGLSGGIIAHRRPKVNRGRVGVIGWTGVLPAHRGKGLGKALVAAALRRVVAQGASVCEVETQPYRQVAVLLYQAAGFRFQQASFTVH